VSFTDQAKKAAERFTKEANPLATGEKPESSESLFASDSTRIGWEFKTGVVVSTDAMFFNFPELSGAEAFQSFNYQLDIWKQSEDGTETPVTTLTLPISPQAISISVPNATSTTVTMKGITEEHNGAPLRQISITGTTGVYLEGNALAESESKGKGPLDYLFANTIQAVGRVVDRAEKIASAFSSGTLPFDSPLVDKKMLTKDKEPPRKTGYTVVHNIQRFLDMYLDAKAAGGANNNLFLSFYMEKDKQYYDVTLNNYTIRKNPGTLEYNYSISLTAWRRRAEKAGGAPRQKRGNLGTTAQANGVNPFARINSVIDNARGIVSDSLGVLRGVDADIDRNLLQPLKKVGLLVKETIGAVKTLADYPDAVSNRAKSVVKASWLKQTVDVRNQRTMATIGSKLEKKNIQGPPGIAGSQGDWRGSFSPDFDSTEGSDSPEKQEESANTLDNVFDDPSGNQDILEEVLLNDLEMTEDVQSAVDEADEAARSMTTGDLEDIRDNIESFLALYETSLGGGDPTFNRIYEIADSSTTRNLTVEDINFFKTLNDAAMAMDSLIRLKRDSTPDTSNDYARYYANYAITQGLDFQESVSKFYVPFQLGSSLPLLALQYLGNPDRWLEIVAINALKAPYIDENGKTAPFIASGAGNTFFIQSSQDLYIGQIITLSSDTLRSETRKITAIDLVSEIQTIIAVDGEGDLSKLRVSENAQMQYFLPGTVNSRMMIAIPSDVTVNAPGNIRINPTLQDLSNVARVAKTDFFLQYNNAQQTADITFTGSDFKTASGYHNLVQAAELKVRTLRGDLLHDTDFGNPVVVGGSIYDVNSETILNQMSSLFKSDPRFGGLIASRAFVGSGAVDLDLLVRVSSSQAYLPFTTSLPRKA